MNFFMGGNQENWETFFEHPSKAGSPTCERSEPCGLRAETLCLGKMFLTEKPFSFLLTERWVQSNLLHPGSVGLKLHLKKVHRLHMLIGILFD